MEWYWILLIVVLSLVFLLFLVYAVAALLVSLMISHPRRFDRVGSKEYNHKMGYDEGTEVIKREPIEFKMKDGYIIHGDYNLLPNSKKFCILVHGHCSNREGSLRYSLIYEELGFSTLIYDQRSHGDNIHKTVTMGYKESQDLAEIITQVEEKFGKDLLIGLHGVSMGASTSLLSTLYNKDPKFIVSDCGFYDLKNVLAGKIRQYHLPPKILLPMVNMDLKLFQKYSFANLEVGKSIKGLKTPVLFIHGDKDTFIDIKNEDKLFDSVSGYKEKVVFNGAIHANSITLDRAKYKESIENFLNNIGIAG